MIFVQYKVKLTYEHIALFHYCFSDMSKYSASEEILESSDPQD
jgi:hypothetical protein